MLQSSAEDGGEAEASCSGRLFAAFSGGTLLRLAKGT